VVLRAGAPWLAVPPHPTDRLQLACGSLGLFAGCDFHQLQCACLTCWCCACCASPSVALVGLASCPLQRGGALQLPALP
jgi:hypothetical protein